MCPIRPATAMTRKVHLLAFQRHPRDLCTTLHDLTAHQKNKCMTVVRDQTQVRPLGVQTFDLTSTCCVIKYATGAQAVIQPANQPIFHIRHPALFDGPTPSHQRQFAVGPKVASTARSNTPMTNQVRRSNSLPNAKIVSQYTSQRIARSNSQPSEPECDDDIQIMWSTLSGQTNPT